MQAPVPQGRSYEDVNSGTVTNPERVLVDVHNLTIRTRHGADIVSDVSFSLARGQVLGLIGESGAGKSTLGLSVLGYTRPGCRVVSGSIRVDGNDLLQFPESKVRSLRGRKISYVAQSAAQSFNPSLRLMNQVCEVPVRGNMMTPQEARMAAIALFRELELPSPETFGDRYPHQVSGGQLQRAMAAMAMITQPDLVVFDEPTTALDVTTQVGVLGAFRRLIKSRGTAAVYITHDLAVVAQMADQLMVMRHGKTVEYGATEQILSEPREEYSRRLVNQRKLGSFAPATPEADDGVGPILSVRQVTAGYGNVVAVSGVTFHVDRGETLAIVGESGSGKSSLARSIVGLLPPRDGQIGFKGEALTGRLQGRSKEQMRRLQIVYQSPDVALNPSHTVREIIGRPIKYFFNTKASDVESRVIELLKEVELDSRFIDRRPYELSGGQKQRVCIARALAAEPDLIVCDEVTSALDPLVAAEVLDMLRRLREERGVAYLFITHDLESVKKVADRVAIMYRGEIIKIGRTADVFSPPYHPYTETLVSSIPEMRTDWLDGVLARGDVALRSSLAGFRP